MTDSPTAPKMSRVSHVKNVCAQSSTDPYLVGLQLTKTWARSGALMNEQWARGLFCHPHDSFYTNTWWHNQSIYQLSNNLLGQMNENTHYKTYFVLGLWELHLGLEMKRERRSVTLQWTVVTFVTRHHQVTVAVGIQKYADCWCRGHGILILLLCALQYNLL